MKALFRITATVLCFVALSSLLWPVKAAEIENYSVIMETEDDVITITVSLKETRVSSIGVYVAFTDGLTLCGADWLIDGILRDFSYEKNKGVCKPCDETATVQGNIFKFVFRADANLKRKQKITVGVIGKNGTDTLFSEETNVYYGENAVLLGDADSDGYIDAYDAAQISKFSVCSIFEDDINVESSDVDGDGYIDAYDASLVQKYSVGSIDRFPAED